MRRYLVVAHRTLGGPHLLEEVQARAGEGPSQFHLLVPVTHPDHPWTEHEVEENARRVLDDGLAIFRERGLDATGEIGDANPVYAVDTVLRRGEEFTGVIVSTLPVGLSRWLKVDVPSRLRRQLDIPITHVVAEREPAQ